MFMMLTLIRKPFFNSGKQLLMPIFIANIKPFHMHLIVEPCILPLGKLSGILFDQFRRFFHCLISQEILLPSGIKSRIALTQDALSS